MTSFGNVDCSIQPLISECHLSSFYLIEFLEHLFRSHAACAAFVADDDRYGNVALWPCNNQKHDQWPSVFYDDAKLKRLSVLTGYEYALLAGPPHINKEAVSAILDDVNSFIETWIHYPEAEPVNDFETPTVSIY